MQAVTVANNGGPDVLTVTEINQPSPGPGHVLVKVTVAGVNYMDIYQRTGGVRVSTPFTAGVEGVGVVTDIGPDVTDIAVGDRIGWLSGGQGTYADYAVVAAAKAVPVPDAVSDDTAAAVLMQGVTAHYLATDAYPVQQGDTVLVHAAAGGVGQLLTQIVRIRGGHVIGTVSSPAKEAAATGAGAENVIGYSDFAQQAKELTDGEGVAAVYDGVGAATFDGSLASLRPRGVYVIYGTASGPTPPLDIPRLNSGGSLYVTRPSVVHYTATTEELRGRAADVFGWIADGRLQVHIGGEYPLADAAKAQADLESRKTTGKLLLRP